MKLLLFIFITLISCSQQTGSGIEINNAWIREAPPGADVAALYIEIENNGPEDSIVSVSTGVSKTAEIHSTEVAPDGTGKMVRLENVAVPSGKVTTFTPGGKHIMLIDLIKEPKAGENHEVIISFKNSGKKSVNAVVKGFGDNGHENHSGHFMDH